MTSDRLILNESQAIELISKADSKTPIILDFDETLLLRNSTAEYLNNLRPRLIGFILLGLLKIIKPWMWLPKPFRGDKTRDWFLVVVPSILLPWTVFLWRQKAKQLAEDYANEKLVIAVNNNSHSSVIFASLGFDFIIDPILQQLPLKCLRNTTCQEYSLVSCRFWQGAKDRNIGKLSMLNKKLSNSEIRSAVVITDSKDDLPLLQVVKYPCLIVWSLAKYIHPFQDYWLSLAIAKFKH